MNFVDLSTVLIHIKSYLIIDFVMFSATVFLLKVQFFQSSLTKYRSALNFGPCSVSSTNKKIAVLAMGK